MAVTTMPSIHSLLSTLTETYPAFTFVADNEFRWDPRSHTIYFDEADSNASQLVLHELSHALLAHSSYSRDIELIGMERDAWLQAQSLGAKFRIALSESLQDESMDSYRSWLHARSTCPNCNAVGMQIKKKQYHCPACLTTWNVNEARTCRLVRTKTAIKK